MRIRTKKIRFFALFCAAWLLLCALGGCAGGAQKMAESTQDLPVIRVGSDNYPPYNYDDANGQPTGIDVDLAKEAFRRMGYQATFVTIDWEEKKELVESGAIDCIWGSFSIDGREDQYNWTQPYMYSRQVVAVRPDSDIDSLADLAGKRVAVQSTTKPEEMFLKGSDPRIPELEAVFSLENLHERATFLHPIAYPTGIEHVFVNGVETFANGRMTGDLGGVALLNKPH